ncbi:MAG: hypothetical protein EOM54_11030 [Clostridia bacterium]|nr:hypothetical protein [Clostridia bacterium]
MKVTGCKMRRTRAQKAVSKVNYWQSPLLFLSFTAGAVLGSLAGTWNIAVSAAEKISIESGNIYGANGFFGLLFFCSKYHLFVVLFGTSLMGVILIPAAFALRGFVLSCTAASLAAAYPENGYLITLVILGLPSLLTVPSLFILGRDSLSFSSHLLSMFDRRALVPAVNSGENNFLVCAAALILAAAIEYSLVPRLVDFLI